MKKTLALLSLIICFAASAQRYTAPSGLPQRVGNFYTWSPGYHRVDSGFFLPRRDTNWTPIQQGAIVYWQNVGVDSTIWLWDSLRWKKIGEGGGSISIDTTNLSYRIDTLANDVDSGYNTVTQLTDSSYTINRLDGTRDTIEFVADTTCGTGGGANTITLNEGTNISITGSATQSISSNPTWTINSVALQWRTPFSASFGTVAGVSSSTTTFGQTSGRASAYTTTESQTQFVIAEDCTANNLFIRTSGAQDASGSVVITLRKNGANTALTVTIPAGSSAGTFSDITHTVSLTAGDLIDWQLVNNATAASAVFLSIGASLTGSF